MRSIKKAGFCLILVVLMLQSACFSQIKDTILNMVLSKPYFYNVIQTKNNKIFVGTSKGIFTLNGTSLIPYNDKKGYITSNSEGIPIIDTIGIRYYSERKYIHLLPFPDMAREEYHASNENEMYICSGGRLHIYDILPFGYSYPNHSFRTISKDLIGTYSGIYLKGVKLKAPFPQFVDRYIRQYGDRAFICNYNLTVLEKEAIETGRLDSGVTYFNFVKPNHPLLFNDIVPSPDSLYYYIGAEKELIRVDKNFTNDTTLFSHDTKDAPIGFIPQNRFNLFFTAGERLYALDHLTGKISEKLKLNSKILDGVYIDQQLYLITANALFRHNYGQQAEKIIDLNQAHTILLLGGSEFVISSNDGLYLVNVTNRVISTIIPGVEFNQRALHKEKDIIYAGSVNGLYTIQEKEINALIKRNEIDSQIEDNSGSLKLYLALIIFLIIVIGIIIYQFRKKVAVAEKTIEVLQTPKEIVNRESIEDYIIQNLSSVSIKNLTDRFNLNAPQLYAILHPDRPGTIIQKLRTDMVLEMKKVGKDINEIAEATGLSVSYIRKIKS